MKLFFEGVLAILGPSVICVGLFLFFANRKFPRKKKDPFLGIDSMKSILRNKEKYPGAFIPIVKVSRRERRKQERKNKTNGNKK
jgi:hypothetical protein